VTRLTLFNSSALASFRSLTLALIATLLITVLAVQFAHAQTEKVAYSFKNRTDGMVLERCTSTARRATRASCIALGARTGNIPAKFWPLVETPAALSFTTQLNKVARPAGYCIRHYPLRSEPTLNTRYEIPVSP
jgi:hypothetical protein